jgi:hypothetical protein
MTVDWSWAATKKIFHEIRQIRDVQCAIPVVVKFFHADRSCTTGKHIIHIVRKIGDVDSAAIVGITGHVAATFARVTDAVQIIILLSRIVIIGAIIAAIRYSVTI